MSTTEIIFLVEQAPEGGYTAQALNESIFTEADDLETLKIMVKDAVNCHFDTPEHLGLTKDEFLKQMFSE
nr:2-oxoisovalerate dehydrogenase [Chamaesiphon sp. GL140_3_metabinner_50]